jgi:hypothetical protein
MDEEIRKLLERQARWQESRKDLSWEEKVGMIERVRQEFAEWCAGAVAEPGPAQKGLRRDESGGRA